jgi:Circadian oscillating protein COP23
LTKTGKRLRQSIKRGVGFKKMMQISERILVALGSAMLVSLVTAACNSINNPKELGTLEGNKTPNNDVAQTNTSTSNSVESDTKNFDCKSVNGVNTTVAITPRGNRSVIRWVSTDFDASGWSSEKRCTEVSKRFRELYANGSLKYLTTGKMNGQRVICSAAQKGERCNALLLTVRPGRDPQQTLKELLNIRVRAAGSTMNESGERLYVDISSYFK